MGVRLSEARAANVGQGIKPEPKVILHVVLGKNKVITIDELVNSFSVTTQVGVENLSLESLAKLLIIV